MGRSAADIHSARPTRRRPSTTEDTHLNRRSFTMRKLIPVVGPLLAAVLAMIPVVGAILAGVLA